MDWGAAAFYIIAYTGFRLEPELGRMILSVLVRGSLMVLGYFLYELLFWGVAAIVEIPVNIGQMAMSLIVSIPVVRAIWRAIPQVRSTYR